MKYCKSRVIKDTDGIPDGGYYMSTQGHQSLDRLRELVDRGDLDYTIEIKGNEVDDLLRNDHRALNRYKGKILLHPVSECEGCSDCDLDKILEESSNEEMTMDEVELGDILTTRSGDELISVADFLFRTDSGSFFLNNNSYNIDLTHEGSDDCDIMSVRRSGKEIFTRVDLWKYIDKAEGAALLSECPQIKCRVKDGDGKKWVEATLCGINTYSEVFYVSIDESYDLCQVSIDQEIPKLR